MIVLALSCAGCSTAKPELEAAFPSTQIDGMKLVELKRALVEYMAAEGYQLAAAEKSAIAFDKRVKGWLALRYGSFAAPEVWLRVQFSIWETGARAFRLTAVPLVVTEKGTSFEETEAQHGRSLGMAKELLERFAAAHGGKEIEDAGG